MAKGNVDLILVMIFGLIFILLYSTWPFYEHEEQHFKKYLNPKIQKSISKSFGSYDCEKPWTTFVVPFRKREPQLPQFVEAITSHQLENSQENYDIIVIEQQDSGLFNRAKLMNVGAKITSLKLQESCSNSINLCLIFHDVDMLPMKANLQYNCIESPQLLASAAEQFNFTLPYGGYFGGVVAFSWDHFKAINGMTNRFWGWGGEDDDLLKRIKQNGLIAKRLDKDLGKFKSLKHAHSKKEENKQRYRQLQNSASYMKTDGLSDLNYKLNLVIYYEEYTHYFVDLLPDEVPKHEPVHFNAYKG